MWYSQREENLQEAEFIEEIEESSEAVDIGQNIRKIRLRSCMSQEVFAERIGVSRQTVVNWERGYSLPAADKVGKIIKECSTTIEEILGTEYIKYNGQASIVCTEEKAEIEPRKKTKISLGKVFVITFLSTVAFFASCVLITLLSIVFSISQSDLFSISVVMSLGDMDKLILLFLACVLVIACVVIGIVKIINFRRVKK